MNAATANCNCRKCQDAQEQIELLQGEDPSLVALYESKDEYDEPSSWNIVGLVVALGMLAGLLGGFVLALVTLIRG